MHRQIQPTLPNGLVLAEVKWFETPTSVAIYTAECFRKDTYFRNVAQGILFKG